MGGSPYWRLSIGGGKHCFSLVTARFCSNNALYSASFSFTMLIFLLTIDSQSDVTYKDVAYKKHVALFCILLNIRKYLSLTSLFLYLSGVSFGRYCQKMSKVEGWEKRHKRLR